MWESLSLSDYNTGFCEKCMYLKNCEQIEDLFLSRHWPRWPSGLKHRHTNHSASNRLHSITTRADPNVKNFISFLAESWRFYLNIAVSSTIQELRACMRVKFKSCVCLKNVKNLMISMFKGYYCGSLVGRILASYVGGFGLESRVLSKTYKRHWLFFRQEFGVHKINGVFSEKTLNIDASCHDRR